MISIMLGGLDFTRCQSWWKRADDCRAEDPVAAFIYAWISFNHYYSTFAFENKEQFQGWCRRQSPKKCRPGDKAQVLFLVDSPEFTKFFDDYKQRYPEHLNFTVELPVINMLTSCPVPKDISGPRKLSELKNNDIFRVVYQIRNNLFHGDKDPGKVQRDHDL
jgi:hypothetical protein